MPDRHPEFIPKKNKKFFFILLFLFLIAITIYSATAASPVINSLVLNSTNMVYNSTDVNLTSYVTTSDSDGDSVKVIHNWYKNGVSIFTLLMPFEKINGTNTNNAKDYSGYEKTGEETNGVLWNESAGYDGKGAYKFDGVNDYLFVGNAPSLNITTNDFTLTAWFKTNQNVYGGIYNILNKGALGVVGYGSLINNNNFTCSIQANGGTNQNFKGGTASINNDTWYFGACVYDRSDQIYKYINGELVGSAAYDSGNNNSLDTGTNFQIGARSGANLFNGTIDQIRIYNRSLSAQQILALYNNRTDLIVAQETEVGEIWQTCAYPNDGSDDGNRSCSNNLTIQATPNLHAIGLNIYPSNPSPVINITANVTYFNESCTAANCVTGQGRLSINWYVNGILSYSQVYSGLNNGTTIFSGLSSALIASADSVFFEAKANTSSHLGIWNSSSTITVQKIYRFCGEHDFSLSSNCTMFSPSLSCTNYSYSLWNESEIVSNNQSLNLWDRDIYSFTFSEGRGDYILKWCNGNVQKFKTNDTGGFVMFIAIFIGIIIFIAIFLFLASTIEQIYFKLMAIIFTLGFGILAYALSMKVAEELAITSIQNLLSAGYKLVIYPTVTIIMLIVVYMFYRFFNSIYDARKGNNKDDG